MRKYKVVRLSDVIYYPASHTLKGGLNRVPLTGLVYISLAFMKIWQSIEAAYPMAIIGVHLRWAAKV